MYPTSPIPTERVRPGGVSLGLLASESEPLALMCSPIQHRAENPESTVEPGLRLCTRWNRGPKPHLLFGHVQSRRLVPQTHTIAGSWMSPHVTWTPSRRGAAPLRTKEPFCAQEATRRPPSATLLLSSAGDPSLDREPWELVHWDEAASAPPTASGLCVLSPGPVLAEMKEQVFPVYWGLSLFRGVCVCVARSMLMFTGPAARSGQRFPGLPRAQAAASPAPSPLFPGGLWCVEDAPQQGHRQCWVWVT